MRGRGVMHGRRRVWRGGGKNAWQERRPLQRAVCIILECILVGKNNSLLLHQEHDKGISMMINVTSKITDNIVKNLYELGFEKL